MGLSIRSGEVATLARELARRRRSNMTEAIAHALRSELARTPKKPTVSDIVDDLAAEFDALAGPNRREVTKDEIDEMWGQ
jgi:antitoxin VapB